MSKFMNYVKKFLTLSFMSTVAAFGLSFNNVFSMDLDPVDTVLRTQGSSEEINYSSGYSADDSLIDESQKSDGTSGGKREHEPSRRDQKRKHRRMNKNNAEDLKSAIITMGALFDATQDAPYEDYEENPGNIYDYDKEKRTAVWTGNEDTNVLDINVPAQTGNYNVVGAVLQNQLPNLKSIRLDTKNFELNTSNSEYALPNLNISNKKNLPNLKKIELDFEIPEQADSDEAALQNGYVLWLALESARRSDLQELLENNSDNNEASWYIKSGKTARDVRLIGESNLLRDEGFGLVDQAGIQLSESDVGGYILQSIPNQPKVVIPAAAVNYFGQLEKLRYISLPNNIKTDKIETIKITNIQDETQKDRIIKYAANMLSGFNNGENDLFDWELDKDDFEENGSLTFKKIYRDTDSILLDTVFKLGLVLKDNSLSEDEKNEKIREITANGYGKLPKQGQQALTVLTEMYYALVGNESYYGDGSSSTSYYEPIGKVLNTFESVMDVLETNEFLTMTNDAKAEAFDAIVDEYFSDKSELTQWANKLMKRAVKRFYDSDLIGSLMNVSRFYSSVMDVYNLIEESKGKSVSDEEILANTMKVLNENYSEGSEDKAILESLATWFIESGKLRNIINDAKGLENNSYDISNTTRVGSLERVLKTLGDLVTLSDEEDLLTMSNENLHSALTKILEDNFSGGSEYTQKAKKLMEKALDKLFNSEFVGSLRNISKLYETIEDVCVYIKDYEGESISDKEIYDSIIETIDKRYSEDSVEREFLYNITKLFVGSGKLRDIMNAVQDLEGISDYLNSDSAQTTDDLSRPEDANSLSTSSSSNSDNSSTSNSYTSSSSNSGNSSTSSSSASNSLSSSSSGTTGTNNTSSEKTIESSKLYEAVTAWTKWMENEGKNVSGEKQYAYLEALIDNVKDKLTEEEKASAAEILNRAYTELVEKPKQSTTPSGTSTSTSTGTASGTTKTTTKSASTKTSDSSVSPELLSLILSGSLAGLGISLKKRHE